MALLLLALNGCASLSQSECLNANWFEQGRLDANAGYTIQRLQAHRSACANYSVVPLTGLYIDGFKRGLIDFCNPQRGFEFGRDGGYYAGTCAPETADAFLDGYRQGWALYRLERRISELELEMYRLEALLMSSYGGHDTAARHRHWLRHRIMDLDFELNMLRFELGQPR